MEFLHDHFKMTKREISKLNKITIFKNCMEENYKKTTFFFLFFFLVQTREFSLLRIK